MDAKLKSMAERAISKETPLKGYELGVRDAAIREESQELVVILLDGRKMVYPLTPPKGGGASPPKGGPNMAAKPDPLAKMAEDFTKAPARTARNRGSRSRKEN
jgi:hypothetical protein